MKILLSVSLFLVLFSCSFGQKMKSQIEISPFIQYDKYPEFSYNLLGRTSTDFLKMQCVSWGIVANYKRLLTQHLYIKAGILDILRKVSHRFCGKVSRCSMQSEPPFTGRTFILS